MRRPAMTALGALACAAALLAPARAQEEKVLNIYNWAEYMADDTVRNFEKETGIKVHVDYFDGDETLHAKMMAGRSGYDIVVPSAVWGAMEIQAGLLRKLDRDRLPNLANMNPALQAKLAQLDPGNAQLFMNYIMRPEVHAAQTNKVYYANSNLASIKYVKKEIADNHTVFLSPADLERLRMPEPLGNDARRIMSRTYTSFNSGL